MYCALFFAKSINITFFKIWWVWLYELCRQIDSWDKFDVHSKYLILTVHDIKDNGQTCYFCVRIQCYFNVRPWSNKLGRGWSQHLILILFILSRLVILNLMVFIDTTIKRKKSGILVYDGINENVQSKQPLCSNIISINSTDLKPIWFLFLLQFYKHVEPYKEYFIILFPRDY